LSNESVITVGSRPIFVTTANIAGDSKPDIIVGNEGSNSISVLVNTTSGSTPTFTKTDISVHTSPSSIAVGDFNNDTKLDLVVGYNNGTVVSVLTNTSSGATPSFTKTDFTVGTSPIGVAVGDFNSDTRPDIAAGNDGSSNVSVLLNTGTPALFPTNNPLTFSTGANSGPTAIAVGDLDGVNGPDI